MPSSWADALTTYSYPVDLSTYENAAAYPEYFDRTLPGDRASTIDFEKRYRERASTDIASTLEVVYWKMYSYQGQRDRRTRIIAETIEENGTTPLELDSAVQRFAKHMDRVHLQDLRDLLGLKSKVLALALTFPAFASPDTIPMVDIQIARWVNDNHEAHSRDRDNRLTPFRLNYTSLQDNDFESYLNWVAWCGEMAVFLQESTQRGWRARDVEMAVFTAKKNGLVLNPLESWRASLFHHNHRKHKKKKKGPPPTERYCLFCERKIKFVYNHVIGHSECVECGGRDARRDSPKSKPHE